MFPAQIGIMEIAIVLVVALVLLGPKKLPEAGRSIGRGMRELKAGMTGAFDSDDDRDADVPAPKRVAA